MISTVKELVSELSIYKKTSSIEIHSHNESSQLTCSYGVEIEFDGNSIIISEGNAIESLELIMTVEELIKELNYHNGETTVLIAESSQQRKTYQVEIEINEESVILTDGNEIY